MNPILITGCARSGTSLISNIIAKHEVFGGDISGGVSKFTPTGICENTAIRDGIVKKYLKSIHVDPKGQFPLPNKSIIRPYPELKNDVDNILKIHGWNGKDQWFYKGAKMTLLWELWHEAFPNAKWVLVRRNDKDIIDSCMRTSFMNKRKTEQEWQKWVNYHKDRFEEMKQVLDIKEVWPEKMIHGDYMEMTDVLAFLKIRNRGTPNIMNDTVNPKHWHNQSK